METQNTSLLTIAILLSSTGAALLGTANFIVGVYFLAGATFLLILRGWLKAKGIDVGKVAGIKK